MSRRFQTAGNAPFSLSHPPGDKGEGYKVRQGQMELFDLMTSRTAGFLHDWWVFIAMQTPPSREIVNEPRMARKDLKTGPMNTLV